MQDQPSTPADLLPRVRRLLAEAEHRRIVELLEPLDPAELVAEPAVGYALAVALQATGRPREARSMVERLREPCSRRGRDRLYRQRLNLEAALAFELGELEVADALWQDLLDLATAAGDHDQVAKASNNLGILHTLLGSPWAAVGAYSRALMASQRLGDRRGLAQAHQNLAITYREEDHRREADSHFRRAMAHARAAGGEDVLGRAEEERALLFLLDGDVGMAEATATRALGRLKAIGDRSGEAESLRVLGLVAAVAGYPELARSRLEAALEAARSVGAALLEAETLAALAAAGAASDPAGAAERSAEAKARFAAMGAESWGLRHERRLRALLGGDDAPGAA